MQSVGRYKTKMQEHCATASMKTKKSAGKSKTKTPEPTAKPWHTAATHAGRLRIKIKERFVIQDGKHDDLIVLIDRLNSSSNSIKNKGLR